MQVFLKIITISIFFSENAFAQQWTIAGDSTISYSDASDTYIAVDNNNTPYVVFRDTWNYSKATVKKFDGIHWITVGNPGFSIGDVNNTTIAFDNTNTPYVAYTDWSNYPVGKATVMKFDGSSWIPVGIPAFTPGSASYPFLAIDQNGTLYIAYCGSPDGKVSVMKFNGTNWVSVGNPEFSSGSSTNTSLSIDKNGVPCVGYWDVINDLMTIKKFDGSNWINVGAPGFAEWTASNNKAITFDSNNTPYVVCAISGKAAVVKFDGSNWIPVGSTGISQGGVGFTSIAMDSNDMPYIAYADMANGQKATVMKFDGVNWIIIGNAGFTSAGVWDINLALAGNGTLYVAYKDDAPHPFPNSIYPIYPGVVMKFENASASVNETNNNSLLTVYPNPTSGVFQINYFSSEKSKLQLNIIDAKGKTVYTETISQSQSEFKKDGSTTLTTSIDLGRQAKGVYFIEIISADPSSQGYEGQSKKRVVKSIVLD